jgi:hypothetical protein
MLKKASSFVLASLRTSTHGKECVSALRLLRPCPWKGASRRAGVGRVRRTTFLTILRRFNRLSQASVLVYFCLGEECG